MTNLHRLSLSLCLSVAVAFVSAGDVLSLDTRAARDRLSRSGRIRFNRVEGLFVGYRVDVRPTRTNGLTCFTQTGYGFDSKKMRWEAGVSYAGEKATATLAAFDRTATKDEATVGTGENTLFSALLKWDYRDYYRAKHGFEAKGSYQIRPRITAVGKLSAFSYESMDVATNWSLVYPDRAYRANPRVRLGDIGLINIGLAYDNRAGGPLFRNAWVISGVYERAFREFDHNGLVIAVRRYQKTVLGSQAFVANLKLGTRESNWEQHLFDLGGVGTLRGFQIKEYTGNRMVLFSIDYLFRGDVMRRVPIKGANLLNLILFFDTGWLNRIAESKGFLKGFGVLSLRDFKTDVGASVALPREIFRFDVARRLDRREDPWVVSARIRSKF